jgi:N-acetylmuramoyl-L-alanine amidase
VVRKENNVVRVKTIGKLVLAVLPIATICCIQTQPTASSTAVSVEKKEVPQIEKVNKAEVPEWQIEHELLMEEYLGELELLATLVEAESGNQDLKGKRLVADVVLNRVENEDYPNSITEVIYRDYQFSTVLDGALDRAGWNISDESFEAVRIEVLESEERLDEDILFFTYGEYNKYCVPAYQYGSHYFGY